MVHAPHPRPTSRCIFHTSLLILVAVPGRQNLATLRNIRCTDAAGHRTQSTHRELGLDTYDSDVFIRHTALVAKLHIISAVVEAYTWFILSTQG